MEEIKKRYRQLHKMEKELKLLQSNIHEKYGELNKLEKDYYTHLRLCLACKVQLLPVEKDIYCDTCLGDTEEE